MDWIYLTLFKAFKALHRVHFSLQSHTGAGDVATIQTSNHTHTFIHPCRIKWLNVYSMSILVHSGRHACVDETKLTDVNERVSE